MDILLLERRDQPGWWQSVTGSLEENESPEQAAVREVAEETGIDTHQFGLRDWRQSNIYEIYPRFRHRYAPEVTHNTEHVLSVCLPQPVSIVLSPLEHVRYVWLSATHAAAQCFSPSNQFAIQQLRETYHDRHPQ